MNITFPANLTLSDWSSQIVMDLDQYDAFSRLMDDDWRGWGSQFLGNMALGGYNLPNPYFFAEWQDWADRFCGALA